MHQEEPTSNSPLYQCGAYYDMCAVFCLKWRSCHIASYSGYGNERASSSKWTTRAMRSC